MSMVAVREDFSRLLAAAGAVSVRVDEPLCGHTTFRIGGPARAVVEVADPASLVRVATLGRDRGLPVRVLGAGSNVLCADGGIDAIFVRLAGPLASVRIEGTRLEAGGGAMMRAVSLAARAASLSGLEFAAALPGTVGGAVAGNAGCAGTCVGGLLEAVEILRPDGTRAVLERAVLACEYRAPVTGGRECILGARFALQPGAAQAIAARMRAAARTRAGTQPLDMPSAGCIFKNPPGDSAGRLIDAAGAKGWREGGACVSPVHANFIVNEGGARAEDVLRLVRRVRESVTARFGVVLQLEVELIGLGEPPGARTGGAPC